MFRLDYISCFLTIFSTVLVGRRIWQGWILAAVNSGIICWIGLQTRQTGFVPANLFCLAIYGYNIYQWRAATTEMKSQAEVPSDTLEQQPERQHAMRTALRQRRRASLNGFAFRNRDRIHPRQLPARR
jgi:nicotinamide riboside transporter PnuC